MKVFLSGVHSGPNPSPGLGTARAIRRAYPNATLIAVDYSTLSSGLHYEVFDNVWLQLPWDQLDLFLYAEQLKQVLFSGECTWISGLDLEAQWLAKNLPLDQILVPPYTAFRFVSKPLVAAHEHLPFSVPPYISIAEADDWSLHTFCRRFDWQVWLKGPYYEARRVRSWGEFEFAREELSRTWSAAGLFLQAHVTGYEESIAFCAYKGELIDCVYMSKRDLTSEGKTWAGKINRVAPEMYGSIKNVIAELGWTGGAELEFVRDSKNVLYLIDWNPRFPAWIYGATIAGHNLPAELVSAALKQSFVEDSPVSQEFIRVVIEIPVRALLPLPPLAESMRDAFGWTSKHPSGMPLLAQRINTQETESPGSETKLQAGYWMNWSNLTQTGSKHLLTLCLRVWHERPSCMLWTPLNRAGQICLLEWRTA